MVMPPARQSTADVLRGEAGTIAILKGWVASKSIVGGIVFLTVRDGSGYVQVSGKRGITNEEAFERMKRVNVESAVSVLGEVKEDRRAPGGKEVLVKDFEVIAPADTWPITKSAVKSIAYLYDNRHLSIRGRKALSVMKVREELVLASIDFFKQKGFHLIQTPSLVQSACEGGATLFELDYFGETAYLSQSAQLYEEAAICALEKVFVIQPAFRAEKSKTPKHLTEFWMVEAEWAFSDQEDNLKLQEEFVVYITRRVAERRAKELKTLGRAFRPPEPPFPRITYDEVRSMSERKGIIFEWGDDIPTEAEGLVSRSFEKPVFITDYPLRARSFYHATRPDNEAITLSDDLIAPEGFGEIVTGGQRIHKYDVLLERLKKLELPIEAFRWYLDLRRYGLPPHCG
ncbi:MAG: asparagine--tRNA ligase, partial [Nitrososphaerota archaeon]